MNGTTVMICDDNETVHQALQLYLKEAGFQVLSAYDGIAALDMIKTHKVDSGHHDAQIIWHGGLPPDSKDQ